MTQVLIIAPHPDDETLGCGGTLLRHKVKGDQINWLIITGISQDAGYPIEKVLMREEEIIKISKMYGFTTIHNLKLPTTRLDILPIGNLVNGISKVFHELQPVVIYLPFGGDAHSDHRQVFEAAISCTKCFRFPSIKFILAYETLSETDFGINPVYNHFQPNVFVDVSCYLDKKIEIMKVYSSELGEFPFPRSEHAIRSLAAVRGVAAGCYSAEAFMLIKGII